jgi:RimJ/RimL family protein N-acetyltransferase
MRGEEVSLEPLRDSDSDRLFEWINDRELVLLSSDFEPTSRSDHDAWFERIRSAEDTEIFGIRRVADDELIGSCQLRGIDRDEGTAELQIRIGAGDGRDRGHGTEAVALLLAHAFGDLGLHRVGLEVFPENERAIRAYEKAGFRREGVLRSAAVIDGERRDIVVMAALRGEVPGGG